MSKITNPPDPSFRLDGRARSFRIMDFTLRDLPRLAAALGLAAGFGLIFGWLPAQFLPGKWPGIYCGYGLGFASGVTFWSWFQRRLARAKAKGLDAQRAPAK